MSGATGEGIPAVLDAVAKVLFAPPKKEPVAPSKPKKPKAEKKAAKKSAQAKAKAKPKRKSRR